MVGLPVGNRLRGTVRSALSAGMAFLIGILLCEAALRTAAVVSPEVNHLLRPAWERRLIPDPELGHRLSPFEPEIDQRGYRNGSVGVQAAILALGDSYTFGVPVSATESWPAVLAGLLKRSVYNAGVVGYGFCEYWQTLQELSDLEPEVVMLAVFTGNDLGDAYRAVYVENRCPELRSTDPTVLEELASTEVGGSIAEQAAILGWDWWHGAEQDPGDRTLMRWLSRESRVYGVLREARYRLVPRPEVTFELASGFPYRIAWSVRPEIRTVFKRPEMMALTVDLSDPRIREGLRIGIESLRGMHEAVTLSGKEFIVVLIPDKTTAYWPVVAATEDPSAGGLGWMAELDSEVRQALSAALDSLRIPFLDVTPSVTGALWDGVAVYPPDDDHHNSAKGYSVIAESIASVLLLSYENGVPPLQPLGNR